MGTTPVIAVRTLAGQHLAKASDLLAASVDGIRLPV